MTYQFTTPDNTFVRATRDDGTSYIFSVENAKSDYIEYIESGYTVEPYVEPPVVPYVDPLEARIAAIESNEISDDATDSALLTLIAGLATRIAALEGGN